MLPGFRRHPMIFLAPQREPASVVSHSLVQRVSAAHTGRIRRESAHPEGFQRTHPTMSTNIEDYEHHQHLRALLALYEHQPSPTISPVCGLKLNPRVWALRRLNNEWYDSRDAL
jgi:hypothetical protein